jgi:TRAP transporter TAXI family solute receptor
VRLVLAFILAALFGLDAASAQEMRNLSILTGQTGSTYHRFGQDIARVLQQECGIDLKVKSSAGSIENMRRLRYEEFTQLAIVQQDILEYMQVASGSDPATRSLISRIRYVYPLYAEEVHLVTTKDSGIASLRDLRGRRVSVGPLESGTFLTAKMILWLTQTTVKEVAIDETTSLHRLLLPADSPDRIDAMFYVVGKPVALFNGQSGLTSRLDLVPIAEAPVLRKYKPTQITPQDYSWLRRTVETVKVGSVLMTFDYAGINCQNVGMVANRIAVNLEELREKIGHPKWREVDLKASVPNWSAYSCVEKYRHSTVTTGSDDRLCRFYPSPGNKSGSPVTTGQAKEGREEADACANAKSVDNPIVKSICRNFEKLGQ